MSENQQATDVLLSIIHSCDGIVLFIDFDSDGDKVVTLNFVQDGGNMLTYTLEQLLSMLPIEVNTFVGVQKDMTTFIARNTGLSLSIYFPADAIASELEIPVPDTEA